MDSFLIMVCLPFLVLVAILVIVGIVKLLKMLIIVGILLLICFVAAFWYLGLIP